MIIRKNAFSAVLLLALFMASGAGCAYSQKSVRQGYDLARFSGLKSEGPTPADLRLSLEELYTLDKQRVRDYNDGKLRNRDKVLKASYQINRTMASGRILYGDPVTRMIERIADTLLKDYPELRQELRFYTLKSPDVNAFATGQGMIFVCTGLVAQVEDEAQLAFVISHEIIHYLKKHSLEEISRRKRDSDDIEAETQEMRDFIKYHNRSREMESEADSLGLTMFYMNSPYDKSVTEGIFDVLQYGYLPFDEVVFDTAYFDSPFYKVTGDCFMRQVDPITARDDYNDSLSTHPNILKRRKATASVLSGQGGGSRFVTISKEDFEFVRTLARFECVRQDIIYSEYVRAFYDCYLLQRLYPDNQYVERALCQSLYGLFKFRSGAGVSYSVGDYKDYEGEVQQCYYLFRRIKKEDLALVAARQLWKSHLKFPDDKQIAAMADDLFADLYKKYKWNADFFSATEPTEQQEDTVSENLSKYERLKRKKNKQRAYDHRSYAFTDLLQAGSGLDAYLASHLCEQSDKKPDTKVAHKNQLVYCPTYYVVSKKDGELNILKSQRSENSLYGHLRDAAQRRDIGSIDFSDHSLHDITDADHYNEWVSLNEWVGEYWQTKGEFDMQLSMQPEMDFITDKYDAGTVNMSIVLNRENLTDRQASNSAILYIWFPPVTPIALNNIFSHSEATLIYSVQIDAHTAKRVSKHTSVYDLKDEESRLRSTLYDHFLHIDSDTLTETPGYMGSRFNVSLAPSMGFNTAAISNLFSDNKQSLLSIGGAMELEYAVKRSRAVRLSAGYMPFKYIESVGGNDMLTNVRQLSFSLGWRVYNHLAPLGTYWEFGGDFALMKVPEPLPTMEPSYSDYGLHLQLGRNYIVKDHILLGYNIRYTAFFNGLTDLTNNETVCGQSFFNNLVRIGLSIGFLP